MSNKANKVDFLPSSPAVLSFDDPDALTPAIRADNVSDGNTPSKKVHASKGKAEAAPARPLRMTLYNSHKMKHMPDPVPDTDIPPPSDDTIYFTPPLITASPSATNGSNDQATSGKSTGTTSASTFIPLSPLLSAAPTPTAENVHAIGITAVLSPMTSTPPAQVQSPTPSHQISKTVIIALSVVGGVVLLGIFIAIRISRRPRRRKCPTPSLPILQDAAFPGQFESQGSESPIFGGNERFSPSLRGTRGNTGLWTWTQYHSSLPKLVPTATVTKSASGEPAKGSIGQGNMVGEKRTPVAGQDQYPFTDHGNFGQRTQPSPQPAQDATTTHAVSRLSTVSMSYYPNSLPSTDCGAVNVGIAIDGTAPLRGDGQPMKRVDDCGGSNSMIVPPGAKDVSSLEQYQSLAYGGMEMITPALTESGRRPPNGGRVRIKTTNYMPGSYPRTSGARSAGPKDRGQHNGLHPGSLQRCDSHRSERQALPSPLRLVSSIPASPHPTLHPQDAMRMIGEAKKVTITGIRSQKKPVPKADCATLGSLMVVDFAASKSVASPVNIHPSEEGRGTQELQCQAKPSPMGSSQLKTSMKKRVDDKPPRVPSPPLLPSLAQMAFAHTNPEDYHSPTYSIYGLYDDRKSRGT